MIIVDKERKTKIDNGYTIKQYVILMCVHTYILNEWEYSVGCHDNMIIVHKKEEKQRLIMVIQLNNTKY